MIKYLFSDIDGTLYINDDVAKSDVHAAHRFVQAGGVFSLATGRGDLEVINFAAEEAFPRPIFRISCNGAMVVDKGEPIAFHHFSQRSLRFLLDEINLNFAEFPIIEMSTNDRVYFLMEPEEWVLNYKGGAFDISRDALAQLIKQDAKIMKMYLEANETYLAELIAKIETHYPDEIEIFNDRTAMNIGKRNVSKGSAIKLIMDMYDIKAEEVAVVGDAANDVSMFEVTPHSFTFHHAHTFVQEQATHVVASVTEAVDYILKYNEDRRIV